MKRHISDITDIELEGVVKSIFPSAFDNDVVCRFNHESNAKVINYTTLNGKYEFLIRYSDNTFNFYYFENGNGSKITPEEYNAIEFQLKQLGFNVPKAEQ
ncbi:hypothetical protein AAE02nite_03200 [Adhaeribacter aerolatus]|uniref:Uncharacterized protein n=1 Tax=Adhaeribacter aerolatus TaxID=670289 RepID=A0A512ASH3_9BACT|nr:hypothetical protein [Adhaeribacter aerolatus]GEO02656.1 hypothetical protein AAE02nite_03200 [Adhaeribacter aerolatus]